MRQAARRLADREKRLVREQEKYQEAEGLQKTAQMLNSSGHDMEQHYESVQVTDYFGANPKASDVPLDASLELEQTSIRCLRDTRRRDGENQSWRARCLRCGSEKR